MSAHVSSNWILWSNMILPFPLTSLSLDVSCLKAKILHWVQILLFSPSVYLYILLPLPLLSPVSLSQHRLLLATGS